MNGDSKLESDAQRQAAAWVRELAEDETPSLAWRSALNERIRVEAERRARRRWRWTVLSPSLGLATAAAIAAVAFVSHPQPAATPTGSRLEASLFALHQETGRVDDAVGTGVRPFDAPAAPTFSDAPLNDLDAGAL